MNKDISTKPLSGYMELNPGEQRTFNALLDTIRAVYEQNGFIPMDQPVVDRTDALLANVGGDTTKELIRVERDDEKGQALRFDLTVPLSRYVVDKYGELTFPFRRYAIGKVYRGERPQAGRFREFYQCDVDIIGNETLSVRHDAEAILIIAKLFTELDKKFGTGKFKIKINNRKILTGLLSGISNDDRTTQEILRLIDKKEKIAEQDFIKQLSVYTQSKVELDLIFSILDLNHGIEDLSFSQMLDNAEEVFKKYESMKTNLLNEFKSGLRSGLDELKRIEKVIIDSNMDPYSFSMDLSIARGLDYYTGTVFETQLIDYPEIGSVCSGGRYDNLASAFTTRKLPGVGMSIGLSRLFDQLIKKGVLKPSEQKTNSTVVIIPLSDAEMSHALALQNKMHASGIACEVSFAESKLDKRMGYANKLGIPYVVLIGEDEAEQNAYTLRNMSDGSEQKLSPNEIESTIKP